VPELSIRLFAIDLDGTLLNSRNEISAVNRAALHRAHDAGVRVCVCTGRCLTESRPALDAIGLDLDDVVCACGALVCRARTGETVSCALMEEGVARDATRFFLERGISVAILHDVWSAGIDYTFVRSDVVHPGYARWFKALPCRVSEAAIDEPWTAPPVRVTVIESADRLPQIEREVVQRFGADRAHYNAIHLPAYDLAVFELFAPGINKRVGVSRLCETYGIEMSSVAAIGDGVNDVEMLAGAGVGVVVENACDAAKAVANMTVPSNDDDGVAVAVEMLLARGA
jgi:Cof subfamily protein (haloacid dehalogenase superfamily)